MKHAKPIVIVVLIMIAVLAVVLPAQNPAAPATDASDSIGLMNSGDLLTLIVALSAYIATIRFVVVGRLSQLGEKAAEAKKAEAAASEADRPAAKTKHTEINSQRSDLRAFLLALIPADAPLVVAAVLLSWRLFFAPVVCGHAAPAWIGSVVPLLFTCAILVLAAHHLRAWCISFKSA